MNIPLAGGYRMLGPTALGLALRTYAFHLHAKPTHLLVSKWDCYVAQRLVEEYGDPTLGVLVVGIPEDSWMVVGPEGMVYSSPL